jgi:hypothetical protein
MKVRKRALWVLLFVLGFAVMAVNEGEVQNSKRAARKPLPLASSGIFTLTGQPKPAITLSCYGM